MRKTVHTHPCGSSTRTRWLCPAGSLSPTSRNLSRKWTGLLLCPIMGARSPDPVPALLTARSKAKGGRRRAGRQAPGRGTLDVVPRSRPSPAELQVSSVNRAAGAGRSSADGPARLPDSPPQSSSRGEELLCLPTIGPSCKLLGQPSRRPLRTSVNTNVTSSRAGTIRKRATSGVRLQNKSSFCQHILNLLFVGKQTSGADLCCCSAASWCQTQELHHSEGYLT